MPPLTKCSGRTRGGGGGPRVPCRPASADIASGAAEPRRAAPIGREPGPGPRPVRWFGMRTSSDSTQRPPGRVARVVVVAHLPKPAATAAVRVGARRAAGCPLP